MNNVILDDKKYIANTYARYDVQIESGKGSILKDVNGKEYIDLGSGIGVNSFGIANESLLDAIIEQYKKVQHTSNLYYTEPCVTLAKTLCERTGLKKVFFANSGAEANECAIKVARKYASQIKGKDCYKIITLKNSFHGRTITTLSATGQDVFHALFNPLTEGFEYATANCLETVKEIINSNQIAGILIECVQGEGGVIPLEKDFVKSIYNLAKENDIVFMVDEVQTGNGRCGSLYAYMQYDIIPDVVTTAKGLGGGLPIGACMMGEKVESVLGFSEHGSTFGGNPIACSSANKVLQMIDEKLLQEVNQKSQYIFKELSTQKGIKSVTGLGLMIGIESEKPVKEVMEYCIQNGVLPLTAKTKLRLLPPLNIPFDLLKKAVEVIKKACE